MSLLPASQVIRTIDAGVVLSVTHGELDFTAYVVISEPDLERIAEFVPEEQFQQDGDVHVAAVADPHDAPTILEDIAFNMNPGDCAVFMCADAETYGNMLHELGQ